MEYTMSRWIDSFESHPFHSTFKRLKELLVTIDEKNIVEKNILDEVIRLNQIIAYIEKYITIIDPKISVSNLQQNLNTSNTYFTNAINEIQAYNSNKNIGHLINANNNIDNALSQLKLYNTILPTFSHQSIYSMLSNYEKILDNSLSKIDLPTMVTYSQEIKNLKKMLIEGEGETLSIKQVIDTTVNDIKSKSNELKTFYNEILNDTEFDNTLKELITKSKTTVVEETKEIHEKYIEFSNKIDELNKFYSKIFGEITSDNTRINGLAQELDNKINTLNLLKKEHKSEMDSNKASLNEFKNEEKDKFQKVLKEKFDTLTKYEQEQQENNKNLYEQIESFLPHATSTGLAKAFEVERKKFKEPIFHWNLLFISSLLLMFFATFFTFLNVSYTAESFNMSFSHIQGIEDTINNLFYKLPLYAPLIWLCIYASKRRSENQRLEQEYAHKEALAKSYSSYKKQIDDLSSNNEELLIKLLNSAIDTISHNASQTLDGKHGDGTPLQSIIKPISKNIESIIINKKINT